MKHIIEVYSNSASYMWRCKNCGKRWIYCYANLKEIHAECKEALK